MRILRRVLVVVSCLGAAFLVGPGAGAQDQSQPWIRVDRVLVNRLGGVSVEGTHSCAAVYDQLLDGGVTGQAWDDFGHPFTQTITADADDVVMIGTNPDNYTVSQPAGRRSMIQVTHESSRLQWCFSNAPAGMFDWTPPCEESGAPCRWVTDRYGYMDTAPLFDYSADGKFKAGLLSISVTQLGLEVEVYVDGDPEQMESVYAQSEIHISVTVKAVNVR